MPKQRRLNTEMKEEVGKLLELKANKQMVQTHFMNITGKAITMKDVHNIAQKVKPGQKNDVQELLTEMKKVEGIIIQAIKHHYIFNFLYRCNSCYSYR